MVTVCPSQFATRRTLFHVLVGCGLLMLKVSRLKLPVIWLLVSMWLNTLTKSQIRSEERFSRNAETDLVCRLLLEKKKDTRAAWSKVQEKYSEAGDCLALDHLFSQHLPVHALV